MLSNRLANAFCTAVFCLLVTVSLPHTSHATTVRMKTVLGPIDIVLYDQEAPNLVANFLAYVNSGAYDNSALGFGPGPALWGGVAAWDESQLNLVKVAPSGLPISGLGAGFPARRRQVSVLVYNSRRAPPAHWVIDLGAGTSPDDPTYAATRLVLGEVTAATMATVDAILALTKPVADLNLTSPYTQYWWAWVDGLGAGGLGTFRFPLVSPIAHVAFGPVAKANFPLILKAVAPPSYQGMWWNAAEDGWA